MTETPAPVAEKKPPRVSKSACTKALRAIFGPKAYFQKIPEGLRALAFPTGNSSPVEIARATLKEGQNPTKEEQAAIPFGLLQVAARAVNFEVTLTKVKGGMQLETRPLPPARGVRRIAPAQEADLCDALTDRGLPINAPCCEGCDKCDAENETPCFAWAQWAFEQIKAAPVKKPESGSTSEG